MVAVEFDASARNRLLECARRCGGITFEVLPGERGAREQQPRVVCIAHFSYRFLQIFSWRSAALGMCAIGTGEQ